MSTFLCFNLIKLTFFLKKKTPFVPCKNHVFLSIFSMPMQNTSILAERVLVSFSFESFVHINRKFIFYLFDFDCQKPPTLTTLTIKENPQIKFYV